MPGLAPGPLIQSPSSMNPANIIIAASLAVASASAAIASPFASRVIAFDPAPGQFVQSPLFNDPTRALGPPGIAGDPAAPDNTKLVTLGGFTGSITLGFDQPIYRNPFNPRGLDFIVFGNSFFVASDPLRRHCEPGVIEVSRDANANGLADDPWFLIPGSHLAANAAPASRTWNQSTLNPLWIPPGRSGLWSTTGYALPNPPFSSSPVQINSSAIETIWGYADLAPTLALGDTDADGVVDDLLADPARFYTLPDDPFTPGISPGSGGGSSISLAWAVNPLTGDPANLDRIDFVRISTGVDAIGILGEISTELSSVADVAPVYTPDVDRNALIDVQDIFAFLNLWFAGLGEHGGADYNSSLSTDVQDIFAFLNAWFTTP